MAMQMNEAGYIADTRFHVLHRRFPWRLHFLVLVAVSATKIVMVLAKGLVTLAVPHAERWFTCCWCHTISRGRNCSSRAECAYSRSVWRVRARDYPYDRDVAPDPLSERKMAREKLWQEFFLDPSQWWDHRSEKVNPRYPDFKHKRTGQSLWLVDRLNPPWLEAELATVARDLLQPHTFSWNVRLRRHFKAKAYQKTLNLFQQMQLEGMMPDKFTFIPVLKACSNLRSLAEGRRVHELIIQRGCESDVYVATCLVDMYVKCGSIENASSTFNRMRERNVVSWSAMIRGYVKYEQGLKALELFRKMQQEGVEPDVVSFVGALNACASVAALEEGRHVHEQIIRRGCESDVYVGACLIDMYAKCGSTEDAMSVFNKIRERDVVSWNAMIGGYAKSKQGLQALQLYRKMQQEGVEPDAVTFVGALSACASVAALEEGRRVHEEIIRRGFDSDVYVSNCLIDMYAKCGSIEDAWSVFNKIRERNVFSWSAMIVGYVKSTQGLKALELFRKMQQEGVEPDSVTFTGALNACASIAALEEGRCVHEQILRRGCEFDIYVSNCLVDMYAKCGSMEDAWSVFSKIRERDVVSWSAIIVGYVKSEQGLKGLELFGKMQQEGVEPDAVTFVGALNACASIEALEEGRGVHEQIIGRGLESDVYVANCLVDMYAKCGSVEDAWNVFKKIGKPDVVSWSAMIVGYVKSGQGLKAMELFREMQQDGVEPNKVTFVGALNACASVAALEEGRRVHEQIIRRGCQSDVYVANCLVDMYAKCGSVEDAWNVFKKIREPDVVSWSAMIVGFVKSEQGLKALELFRMMRQEGVEPNTVTFLGALNACASMAALQEGRCVHKQIIQRGCQADVRVANCLVDMYAKCGSIKDARKVFNRMRDRNVVSWSAMIGGYASHGHSKKAIELFERMGKERVQMDEITFTCLLSACNHGGLVEEGLRYFNTMSSHYNVFPTREHHACMVDLLGRAGWLEEAEEKAEEMMRMMSMEGESRVWMSLLGSCRIHGNIEIAERAAKRCWELDPESASAHLLLSNIYAAAGKWDCVATIENKRLKRKLWKEPRHTWTEVKNVVHLFAVNGEEHPQLLQINAELERLSVQMNDSGYIPDARFLPHEETNEGHLCLPSEKLAFTYGLMSAL